MALFKQKPEQAKGDTADGLTPAPQPLNLEIHTMPKKFLGIKPNLNGESTGRAESDDTKKETLAKPGGSSIKKRIIIAVVIVIAVGLVMAGAAWYFFMRTDEQPAPEGQDNNPEQVVTEPETPTGTEPETEPETQPETEPEPIAETLSRPVQLAFDDITGDSLTLSWVDTSNNEQGFRIYRSSVSSIESASIVSSVEADIENYTLINLNCGSRYYFWVMAYKDDLSAASEGAAVTTGDCLPVEPLPEVDLDKDNDLLSEAEEFLFGTDPVLNDSDRDGYPDGQEVIGLFDPRFGQGATLSDSNSVRTFASNEFNYRLLIPISWQEEFQSETGDQINFVGNSEQFIGIIISQNTTSYDNASDWYLGQFPSVSPSELGTVEGQNISGITTPDGLSTYFVTSENIYTLTYYAGLQNQLEFLTTYRMMAASFGVYEDPFTN